MTDFQSSYKFLLFDKILPCGNFWQHNSGSLNIFRISLGNTIFSVYLCAALYGDRDVKMGYSIFWTFFEKKFFLHFFSISTSNIVESIFRSSRREVFCRKTILFQGLQLYWKRDSDTGVFLWVLQKLFRTPVFIEHLWWLLLHFLSSSISFGLFWNKNFALF